jgi:hypothetical protein
MAKPHRRKRKNRTEIYRIRASKLRGFLSRIPDMVRGGNPMGVGEATLQASAGPGLDYQTLFMALGGLESGA